MGFNVFYLPEADVLRRKIKEDRATIIKRIKNANGIIGPSDSIKIVEKLVK